MAYKIHAQNKIECTHKQKQLSKEQVFWKVTVDTVNAALLGTQVGASLCPVLATRQIWPKPHFLTHSGTTRKKKNEQIITYGIQSLEYFYFVAMYLLQKRKAPTDTIS